MLLSGWNRKDLSVNTTTRISLGKRPRYLVTGAAGSVGQAFICHLGIEAIAVDLSESALFQLNHPRSFIGDIKNPAFIKKYKPHTVIHCAAYKHVPFSESNVEAVVDNNINGTAKLLEACAENGVSQFIFISTDKAVDPISVMGLTKAVGERLVNSYSDRMQTTIVRFGNVLDSSGSVRRIFQKQKQEKDYLTVTSKRCTRYFIEVEEAIKLSLEAAKNTSGTFVFDMGEPKSIYNMARRFGGKIRIIGLRPGEKEKEVLVSQFESKIKTAHPKIWRIYGVYS